MSREIKRVPVDFDWPLNKVWKGYVMPDRLEEIDCRDCGASGYSEHANQLHKLWYGQLPFTPEITGSTSVTAETPAMRRRAEWNVERAAWYYGTGEEAIVREAQRLADLYNTYWSSHLTQDDVDALVDAGRLMDFTHVFDKDAEPRWQKIEPPVRPSAAEVNEWSMLGMGHDSINCSIAIKARCKRDGKPHLCATCDGHGTTEAYEGQRAEADAWEPTEPPSGDGWQLWETVSDGSPISPVFSTRENLIEWLTTDYVQNVDERPLTRSQAEGFVDAGSAPTLITTRDEKGVRVVEGSRMFGDES